MCLVITSKQLSAAVSLQEMQCLIISSETKQVPHCFFRKNADLFLKK